MNEDTAGSINRVSLAQVKWYVDLFLAMDQPNVLFGLLG